MNWLYSNKVKQHFFHPQNIITTKAPKWKYNGVGTVGSPACGDIMKFWLFIDPKTEKIRKVGWQTFGCASAIGSTSMLSQMLLEKGGLTIDQALQITPQDIIKRLGGLPNQKIHCSVLGDKALQDAINYYFLHTKQKRRLLDKNARIIDPETKTTVLDIEQAVREGAGNITDVQKILKVGISNKKIHPLIEELINQFKQKYQKY